MSEPKHRIVILGGGFAGLHTAIELHKRRSRLKHHEITLVDRQSDHVYTPLLYEVSAGLQHPDTACASRALNSAVSVSLAHYDEALRKCCFNFVRGEAVKIHHEEKEVELKDGRRLPYDFVVSALGSVANTYGIKGVSEYGHLHKTAEDAVRVNQRVCELAGALVSGQRPHVKIVVGGAGPTGCELAGELAMYFRHFERLGKASAASWSVRLMTADAEPLAPFSPKVRRLAAARLAKVGVDFHPNARITEVRPGEVMVGDPDGEMENVPFDLLVWTAGVKPVPGMGAMNIPVDAKGFASVGSDFRMKGQEDAFALGDATAVVSPKTGTRVPMIAQAAVREASIVAENIVRRLERRPLVSWTPPETWISAIPIGGPWGIADFHRVVISGRIGFWVRKAADLSYYMSVMPWRDAFRVWKRGSVAFRLNDE